VGVACAHELPHSGHHERRFAHPNNFGRTPLPFWLRRVVFHLPANKKGLRQLGMRCGGGAHRHFNLSQNQNLARARQKIRKSFVLAWREGRKEGMIH
jgi:hypothetical protein